MKNRVRPQSDFDLDSIFQTVATLRDLLEQLNELYPQRSFLITQLGLTLLVRGNHLVYGIYGSGKSELLDDLLTNLGVSPEDIFRIDMSRQTTESELIGPIDLPTLRDKGIQVRNPIGTIRNAKYAELGEFFDAPMMLRLLLSILHERKYRRGGDSQDVELRAAFASTNVAPSELIKQYKDADAVIDRFLFQCTVEWLSAVDDIRKMFNKFRKGLVPSISLDYKAMSEVSDLIISATDQLDDSIVEVIIEIVVAFRKAWQAKKGDGWRQFSDRAFTQWLMVAEALAILHGHYKVTLDDLYGLKYVACNGSPEQLQTFEAIVHPIIEKALKEQVPMTVDDAVMMVYEAIKAELVNTPKQPDDDQLVTQKRRLNEMKQQVAQMKAERPENRALISDLLKAIDERITLITKAIDGVPL